MVKTYRIYRICNTINDTQYIGATERSLSARWAKHKCSKRTDPFHVSMREIGSDKFSMELIEELDCTLFSAIVLKKRYRNERRDIERRDIERREQLKKDYHLHSMMCQCGEWSLSRNMAQHLRSKRHIAIMNGEFNGYHRCKCGSYLKCTRPSQIERHENGATHKRNIKLMSYIIQLNTWSSPGRYQDVCDIMGHTVGTNLLNN